MGGSHAYVDLTTGVVFALTKHRIIADFSAAEQFVGILMESVANH